MNALLQLRRLTWEDLSFADSLRSLAGWNQTRADWERFLLLEPDGCFLAEWQGAPAGTATTIVYGTDLAWIGMVLVHPEYRRRGIGRALLDQCIRHLSERGVSCLKLDATPEGQKVYANLGFHDEWTLTRWERDAAPALAQTRNPKIMHWQGVEAIAEIDAMAFGGSRIRLVRTLAKASALALMAKAAPGHIAGYGLLRPGSRALYLGPIAADSPDAGLELVEALLQSTNQKRIFWDIPDENAAAVTWAQQHGFTRQRPLRRMYLGRNVTPGDPQKQFAIAGPELG